MLASLVNQAIARLRNECEPWPNVSSMEQAKLLYSSTMDDWAAENVDELLFLAVDFSTVDDRHLRMVRELVDRAPKLRLLQFCGTSGVPAEFLHDLLNAHNGLVVDISPLLDMAEVAIAKLTSRIFERVLVLDMLVTHSDQAVEMLRNWFGPDDCMALALTQLQTARFRQTAVSHLW
jgi:hypothetical protein